MRVKIYSKSMKTQHFYFRYNTNKDFSIIIQFSLDYYFYKGYQMTVFFLLINCQYA